MEYPKGIVDVVALNRVDANSPSTDVHHPENNPTGSDTFPVLQPSYVFSSKPRSRRPTEPNICNASLVSQEDNKVGNSILVDTNAIKTMPLPLFHSHRCSTIDTESKSAVHEVTISNPAEVQRGNFDPRAISPSVPPCPSLTLVDSAVGWEPLATGPAIVCTTPRSTSSTAHCHPLRYLHPRPSISRLGTPNTALWRAANTATGPIPPSQSVQNLEGHRLKAFLQRKRLGCLRSSLQQWYRAMFRRFLAGTGDCNRRHRSISHTSNFLSRKRPTGLEIATAHVTECRHCADKQESRTEEPRTGSEGLSRKYDRRGTDETMRHREVHQSLGTELHSGRCQNAYDSRHLVMLSDKGVPIKKFKTCILSTHQKTFEKVHLADLTYNNRRDVSRKGSDEEDAIDNTAKLSSRISSQELEVQDIRVNWFLTGSRYAGETKKELERRKKSMDREPLPRHESNCGREIQTTEVVSKHHGTSSYRKQSRSKLHMHSHRHASRSHSHRGNKSSQHMYNEENRAQNSDSVMSSDKHQDRHSPKRYGTPFSKKRIKSLSHSHLHASRRHKSLLSRVMRSSSISSTLSSNATELIYSQSHSSFSSSLGRHTTQGLKYPPPNTKHRHQHQKGRKTGYSSSSTFSRYLDTKEKQRHMDKHAIYKADADYLGGRLLHNAESASGRSSFSPDETERRRNRNLVETECGLVRSGIQFNSKRNARSVSKKDKNIERHNDRLKKPSDELFPATTVAVEMLQKFLHLLQATARESHPPEQHDVSPSLPKESNTHGDRTVIDQKISLRHSTAAAHSRSLNDKEANVIKSNSPRANGQNGPNYSLLRSSGSEAQPKVSEDTPLSAASDVRHHNQFILAPSRPSTDYRERIPQDLFLAASHRDGKRGRGASAPPWGHHLRLTPGSRRLSCGRFNPYCAVCRAQYNRILVDADGQPLRWPRSHEYALNDLFGDCRYHNGYVLAGPGLLSSHPLVPIPEETRRSTGKGSKWTSGSFVPVRLGSRRAYSATPRLDSMHELFHGKRGSSVPRSSLSLWPQTLPKKVCEDKRNSWDTNQSQKSPTRLFYDRVDTVRDLRDSGSSVETQFIMSEVSKPTADMSPLRRRERRLRHHMKELLSHKPPERRDSQQWELYMKTLSDGLEALDILHRRRKCLEVL
ncbi:unnamed protein product [Phytomonas sp. Hart1]|nr:unnamed protein product [Phytomonas sp. Hart1]|eukprot:CCW67441.1 unnamed protein product [Phytomonas sp. isolate Hart1]